MTSRGPLVLFVVLLAGLAGAQEPTQLGGMREKVSYALGMNLARQLRAQAVEVDREAFGRGLEDALSGRKTLLTEREVSAIVTALQSGLKARQAVKSRKIQAGNERAEATVSTVPASQAVARIVVSFKLDPRLLGATYGGERWVMPPTYTEGGEGKTCTVEARVNGLDAKGKSVSVNATWTPANGEMVTVTPGEGKEVKILVRHAGESTLRVTSPEGSTELTIKARYENDVLQVAISQKGLTASEGRAT